MCDIWKLENTPELTPDEFLKLPSSLRDINISGGEPFLRADLAQIIKNCAHACPRARIVISTNGFATALIIERMREILRVKSDIGVAISIDGIGAMHDELRGVPGGFDSAIATVKALQKLGMTNLRLAFTLMEKNIAHFSRVYDLAKELGVEFAHSLAQSSDIYFGGKKNINDFRREQLSEPYRHIIASELKSWNLKRWLRAYFNQGSFEFITTKNPPLSSAPGRDFFFLDPHGRVYPSVIHSVVLIDDFKSIKNFADSWCSPAVESKRAEADALKIPLWMMCVARTAMKKNPIRVLFWVFKNKFFYARATR
jgi:MoaA/NifB/PqqE/SkfB family radical SAM enzyme